MDHLELLESAKRRLGESIAGRVGRLRKQSKFVAVGEATKKWESKMESLVDEFNEVAQRGWPGEDTTMRQAIIKELRSMDGAIRRIKKKMGMR